MKILVTTPTGRIGRRVLRELLAPEFSVRVIARDPARLPEAVRENVEVIRGSTDDAATLHRALEDVDSMFWCVPAPLYGETDVVGHYERFARAAAQAIRESGTPRVVTISSLGRGVARNAGPLSALHAMEDVLAESGAAIRHLRCGWFMENFQLQAEAIAAHGVISAPLPGNIAIPMVAVTDIADSTLRWLVRRDWSGVTGAAVHGPEDLTFEQAAGIIERAVDRPIRYQEASANQFVHTLMGRGASEAFARSLVDMYAELATGIARSEPRTAESTTATRLGTWVQSDLLPFVQSVNGQSSAVANSTIVCNA